MSTALRGKSSIHRSSSFSPKTFRIVDTTVQGLQFGPLICIEYAADAEQHLSVGLLKVGSSVGDFVYLRECLALVDRIGIQQGLEQ
ncbi:hypothetical protein HDF17_001922 [Granulicella arctica]|uniref:Uncharacterized protein n=1 Tax=Granulicella arctica TaxID=940613 RepID=A0A7Y9TKW7_9BACT|nr:hypothetical protein [Granulicella arctica]NYF79602.1 hypothetical protein [Granulicella arctica]